MPMLVSLLIW
jgi:hypothetical protein